MSKFNWTWTFVLAASAAVAWLSCSKIESSAAVWNVLVKLFVYTIVLWVGCSILNNIYQAFAKHSSKVPEPEVPEGRKQWLEELRKKSRQTMQKETNEKADSFKERILLPREEAKRKKQDDKLNLIMGNIFRGTGQQLATGEEMPDKSDQKEDINEDARERRRLPPDVILHRQAQEAEPEKKKRVIELPAEPAEGDRDTVTVTLHTPLDQRKSRRFLRSCTLQVVLDFMTTLGFNEAHYTLSSSYPRKPLTEGAARTLEDLGFQRRTLLYIEEKD